MPTPFPRFDASDKQTEGGKVAQAIQHAYGIGTPPGKPKVQASSATLAPLLGALHTYTVELERRDKQRRTIPVHGTDVATGALRPPDELSIDLLQWRTRLNWYLSKAAVPDGQALSHDAVKWTIAEPLLLGFYRGPDGTWPPAAQLGWGEGAPADGTYADIRTPFELAQNLDYRGNLRMPTFTRALKDSTSSFVASVPKVIGSAAEELGKVLGAALSGIVGGMGTGGAVLLGGAALAALYLAFGRD